MIAHLLMIAHPWMIDHPWLGMVSGQIQAALLMGP